MIRSSESSDVKWKTVEEGKKAGTSGDKSYK